VFVYLSEAHASDVWPVNQLEFGVKKHRSEEDRMAAATILRKNYAALCDSMDYCVLDTMEDTFNGVFASWPLRYWCIGESGDVTFKAMPKNSCYRVEEFEAFLRATFK